MDHYRKKESACRTGMLFRMSFRRDCSLSKFLLDCWNDGRFFVSSKEVYLPNAVGEIRRCLVAILFCDELTVQHSDPEVITIA